MDQAILDQIKALDQDREAIHATIDRIEIGELPNPPSVLCRRLQVPMLDELGSKALFVFNLH